MHTSTTTSYVSTTIVAPRAERSTWISASRGSDTISIPSSHKDWDADAATLFIGVLGNTMCDYTLRVTMQVQQPEPVLSLRVRCVGWARGFRKPHTNSHGEGNTELFLIGTDNRDAVHKTAAVLLISRATSVL